MPHPRFSLRVLLIVTALLAGFCYWRDRPRQNARRFAALIMAGDYTAASAKFGGDNVGFYGTPSIFSNWEVQLRTQSAAEWLGGRYPLLIKAEMGQHFYSLTAEAYATKIVRADDWMFHEFWLDAP